MLIAARISAQARLAAAECTVMVMLPTIAVLLAILETFPFPAEAHDIAAAAAAPAGQLPWSFDLWLLVCLGLSACLYGIGVGRLWRRAGRRRGVGSAQIAAFAAGWLAIVAALVSPLDALADQLFSAHMVEHEILEHTKLAKQYLEKIEGIENKKVLKDFCDDLIGRSF